MGTPANLQRKEFDNWSAKKPSVQGLFGTSSSVVHWGDFKERDLKMQEMRVKYELNDQRRALIREAFNKLDADGDGLVTQNDIRKIYQAHTHPLFKSNRWTEEQVFYDVLARLKGREYEPGYTHACLTLTIEEFEDYYAMVGADLDDDYFAAMIVQAWRLHKQPHGFTPVQVLQAYFTGMQAQKQGLQGVLACSLFLPLFLPASLVCDCHSLASTP